MNEYKWYNDELTHTPQPNIVDNNSSQKNSHRQLITTIIILFLILLLCISVTTIICFKIFSSSSNEQHPTQSTQTSANNIITMESTNIDSQTVSTTLSSVVNIENAGELGGFFGQTLSLGEGTGVIVREDGYILTSLYVVESVGDITVKLNDGTKHKAQLFASDAKNKVAILKIDKTGLTPIKLGDSSLVKLGDAVSVIGNCVNENLSNPITVGTISGINNNVPLQSGQAINLFQVDAPILINSVGGLVLNKDGELIAMSLFTLSNQTSSVGTATPINDLKSTLNPIASGNNLESANLIIGVSGTDAPYGIIIDSIGENSPAEKAGLKSGDLIMKVDGESVKSIDDLTAIKNKHKKGDTLIFSIYREGEIKEIKLVLE